MCIPMEVKYKALSILNNHNLFPGRYVVHHCEADIDPALCWPHNYVKEFAKTVYRRLHELPTVVIGETQGWSEPSSIGVVNFVGKYSNLMNRAIVLFSGWFVGGYFNYIDEGMPTKMVSLYSSYEYYHKQSKFYYSYNLIHKKCECSGVTMQNHSPEKVIDVFMDVFTDKFTLPYTEIFE